MKLRILIALAVMSFPGISLAQEPMISIKFDGLSIENAIRTSCSEVLNVRIVDEYGRRMMTFRRGATTVATMWQAPIRYQGWVPSPFGGWSIDMHSGHTESDVQALVACFSPFSLPTQPYGPLTIHR